MFLWQREAWPQLTWSEPAIREALLLALDAQARLSDRLDESSPADRLTRQADAIVREVVASSAIEGVVLDEQAVNARVRSDLGLSENGFVGSAVHSDGPCLVALDTITNSAKPLTKRRLLNWHAAHFSTGLSNGRPIRAGEWRDDEMGPMQVVSGDRVNLKVHFVAPPANQLDEMMADFLRWLNTPSNSDPLVKTAVAHLRFLTVHPFDDGNGRLARVIASMGLAKASSLTAGMFSISGELLRQRNAYYQQLEEGQRGDGDVSDWVVWFLSRVAEAFNDAADIYKSTH